MEEIIGFILIFAVLFFLASAPFLTPVQKAEIGQIQQAPLEEEEVPGSGTLLPSGTAVSPKPTTPKILVDTFIIGGPEEGEVIEEKTKITFKFEAKITPEQTGNLELQSFPLHILVFPLLFLPNLHFSMSQLFLIFLWGQNTCP